jgi:hypothetical protein
MLSHYLHIPFPEQLTDEVFEEKTHQLKWLLHKLGLSNDNHVSPPSAD